MKPRSIHGFATLVAAACALLTGCSSIGLSLDELPSDPIAVTWWEPEPARRRAELLDQQKAQQEAEEQKAGVARVEAIGQLFGAPGDRADMSRFPGRLALVDPQTAQVTPVRSVPRGALPLSWSDDHQRLLFLSNHRGTIQIYEFSRESEEVRTITSGPNPHMYAAYGKDHQITYLEVVVRDGAQFERIWVTDTAGGSPRVVLEDQNAQTMRLSPDGKKLLYVRRLPTPLGREERVELVSLDLATGHEQRMGAGREPSFSPIGDWIVYSSPSRAGWRLRRMRPDGSARSPVVGGIRDEKMPAVSPDGRFVAYVGEAMGLERSLERLFVRRVDGSGDRILLDSGSVFAPVW